MQENFSIFTKNLLFVLQVRKTHSGIDQMSLISESVQNCILETPESGIREILECVLYVFFMPWTLLLSGTT